MTGSPPPLPFHPTVPGLIHFGAERFGDRELAVTYDGVRLTYAEAESASRHLALRLLESGAGKGTRIAGHFPYGAEWLVAWLAVSRIGAVWIPFSTAYKPAELRKSLRHSDAALLIAPRTLFGSDHVAFIDEALGHPGPARPGHLRLNGLPYLRSVWLDGDSVEPLPSWATAVSVLATTNSSDVTESLLAEVESEVTPADLAIAIYTSGTTNTPKGVLHTQGALTRKGHALAWYLQWGPDDRIFCGMPFFWVGGIAMTVVPAMAVGATLLCVDRTDPDRSLDLMEREVATRMTGWPGVIGPIMSHPTLRDRKIPALTARLVAVTAVGGTRLVSSLGMTETLASHSLVNPDEPPVIVPDDAVGICMGPPVEGFEHRIVDPQTGAEQPEGQQGALLVRGYGLMDGMIKREREETFTPDGWYDTGDQCYFRDGLLYLTGRLTEMIKTSGNNVAPPEVEAVLVAQADVAEAYVLGVPDVDRGEIVSALVVAAPGVDVDVDQLREQARKDLSNYKVPREIVLCRSEEVPWLATGKPDRLGIRALLVARHEQGK